MLEMLKERREALKAQGKKGFTLMEMLIVIAIIAILIAIAIPVFTSQLENAREATDAANIRSAYAEVTAAALSGSSQADVSANDISYNSTEGTYTKTVRLSQQTAGWQNAEINSGSIGSYKLDGTNPTPNGTCTVTASKSGQPTVSFSS